MYDGISRDDIASLSTRKKGQSIVCAKFSAVTPDIEIQDESGKMTLTSIPGDVIVSLNDICLFLFECRENDPPHVERITVVPTELKAVYKQLLFEFRRDSQKTEKS